MVDAIADLDGVELRDLYEDYPDFNIDVTEEQKRLDAHDIIVFQHPLYWYSCPALLKEWMDLVLEFNYAFGPEGIALHGKKLLTVITTGGSTEAYTRKGVNRSTIQELLVPFAQTAHFCGYAVSAALCRARYAGGPCRGLLRRHGRATTGVR